LYRCEEGSKKVAETEISKKGLTAVSKDSMSIHSATIFKM
jgi:hypothetical protein